MTEIVGSILHLMSILREFSFWEIHDCSIINQKIYFFKGNWFTEFLNTFLNCKIKGKMLNLSRTCLIKDLLLYSCWFIIISSPNNDVATISCHINRSLFPDPRITTSNDSHLPWQASPWRCILSTPKVQFK